MQLKFEANNNKKYNLNSILKSDQHFFIISLTSNIITPNNLT